jgi:hypothetical protein
MDEPKNRKYFLTGRTDQPIAKAEERPTGWLLYELPDGTSGLARPGDWYEVMEDGTRRRVTGTRPLS